MSKVFTITEGLENMGALRTGGQGSVYKGKRMGEIITAVKILPTPIHTENIEDKNFRNFKSEVEKLKKVNEIPNPNVVKIVNSGLTESGSFPFIEMEYIEGPDLEDLLKAPNNPIFTIRETLKLADQLANALAHCHRVGVKHGDIKGNNVKFNTATGNYILLDFGLAIMSDEQRRSSVRNAGAVEFMAPEQHDGEMFFQTDIYSYGIILFELLAGTVPFPLISKTETSRNAVMLAHIEKPVPDLLALRRNNLPESWTEDVKAREMNVPDWLLQLIKKCLEKRPEYRFSNGVALQEAILDHNAKQEPAIIAPAVAVQPTVVQSAPGNNYITNPAAAPSGVRIPVPVFAVMILAIVALSMFAAYSIYLQDDGRKQVALADTTASNKQDTVSSSPAIVHDTIPAITTAIPDSAARQAEIDSLRREFEQQANNPAVKAVTPATPPPVTQNKENTSAEPILVSEGKKYKIPKGATYFYEAPNPNAQRKGVLGLWTNTKFTVIDEQNGFIYVSHSNNDGDVTKGWLKKADLKEVQ